MKLTFFWIGLVETYECETWKECCEECLSQVENWKRELKKIMIETQTGEMKNATEEVNAYYNVLLDASIGLEE